MPAFKNRKREFMKAKKLISWLLLAFVMVSIGVAIGKELEKRKGDSPAARIQAPAPGGEKVIVYYMHGTFRCRTCNLIESMGQELVRSEFAEALSDGRLEWRPVNYQENNEVAKQYKVGGNMIILSRLVDGKEVEHKRLDRVMELSGKRDEFFSYVRTSISSLLMVKQ